MGDTMKKIRVLLVAVLGVVVIGCASVDTKPSAEARAALAPTGKLRVGVYLGNPLSVVRDQISQEMKGAGFELGQQLARRMDVPFEPVVYPSVGALLEGAKSNQWDVALFQVSPARARDFDFTPAIVEVELGYLVPSESRLTTTADADAAGMRIAVQEKSQSDAVLSRIATRATLVRVPGLAAALEAVKAGKADAIGTTKPSLFELSSQLPGSRVLDGRFAQEHIAMAIPKGRDAGVPYARQFVEEAKSRGLVKAAIEKSGARGAVVAPPQSAL
jgi:polar amino acid transport system substrate-binding protein